MKRKHPPVAGTYIKVQLASASPKAPSSDTMACLDWILFWSAADALAWQQLYSVC